VNNVLELHTLCQKCKNHIKKGEIFYKHPEHGIVCEYCPEFNDGGIEIVTDYKEPNNE